MIAFCFKAKGVSQNGSTAGVLRSFAIGSDGTLSGVYSNGRSKPIAQLSVANFANPKGLIAAGDNHFRRSNATGEALMGILMAIPIVAAGRGDVLALPGGLQLGGSTGETAGLLILAGIGWWLYRVGVRKVA